MVEGKITRQRDLMRSTLPVIGVAAPHVIRVNFFDFLSGTPSTEKTVTYPENIPGSRNKR